MVFNTIHTVHDLPNGERASLESLLGRRLDPECRVQIVLYPPAIIPGRAARQEAAARIEQFLDRAAESARDQGVADEEIDAAVEEAIEHIRTHPA